MSSEEPISNLHGERCVTAPDRQYEYQSLRVRIIGDNRLARATAWSDVIDSSLKPKAQGGRVMAQT
jgi:hypothetical protein